MVDLKVLRGSTVRDSAGTRGEILRVSLPWVSIGWWDEGKAVPREESFLRSDPRIACIEILTITEGWVPAVAILGAASLQEDELLEKKPRTPFKTATKLGHSVRFGKWRHKRDYWDCSGKNYKYTCKGKEGEVKKIKRDPEKKAEYNQDYKEFVAAKKKIASSFTKITLKNRRKRAKAKAAAAKAAKKK